MLKQEFDYQLPEKLIAQTPKKNRTTSKMLFINRHTGKLQDNKFYDILSYFNKNDCLVINDTKVIPARIYTQKESGGKIEILLERILTTNTFLARVKNSKKIKIGDVLYAQKDDPTQNFLTKDCRQKIKILKRKDEFFVCQTKDALCIFESTGHMPLPPYIKRKDNEQDRNYYQSIFATNPGAVAAPTASLHFDKKLLQQIEKIGVKIVRITLHIGSGTYAPVRVDNIKEHKMHKEWLHVSSKSANTINLCKKKGGRVVCVGTTSVRALETVAKNNLCHSFSGESDLFITPGFKFSLCDALLTNFHLPQSTLLMLVSAFASCDIIKKSYQHAIKKRYRFFSYGDATFIYS
jgi:S-adenosylmethionine:tRNA ribosyltransferase-isomerase